MKKSIKTLAIVLLFLTSTGTVFAGSTNDAVQDRQDTVGVCMHRIVELTKRVDNLSAQLNNHDATGPKAQNLSNASQYSAGEDENSWLHDW